MKKLPPIKGLLQSIADKQLQASREAVAARSQRKDPRLAHEAGQDADRLAKDAGILDEIADEDIDMVIQIETVADFLRISNHGSALRTLAMRKLEEASACLRREVGDAADEVPSAK